MFVVGGRGRRRSPYSTVASVANSSSVLTTAARFSSRNVVRSGRLQLRRAVRAAGDGDRDLGPAALAFPASDGCHLHYQEVFLSSRGIAAPFADVVKPITPGRLLTVKRLLPLLLCLLTLPACHAADWYPGIIHLHTQYSDGALRPAELATVAKKAGAKFIIVTDHYDMIGKPTKGGTAFSVMLYGGPLSLLDAPWGFPNYCSDVSRLTEDGQFVAIPGAEIGAKWNPEKQGVDGWTGPDNEASTHILALGVIRELDSQMMDQYCEKLGKQQDIINKIRQWGMLPVAAHPSFLRNGTPGDLSYTGRIDYRYDKRPADQVPGGQVQYKEMAGVEIWDAVKADQRQEDIDFYLRLIREGYRPFVVAGSDSHGYTGATDERLATPDLGLRGPAHHRQHADRHWGGENLRRSVWRSVHSAQSPPRR